MTHRLALDLPRSRRPALLSPLPGITRGRRRSVAAACALALSLAAPGCGLSGQDVDCDDPSVQPGDACSRAGAVCQWADDCGGQVLECLGGRWLATSGTGCFADPIPCEEGPAEGDNCDPAEPCDPDGDCRDVLECEWGAWKAYEVCSQEYCAGAAPAQGQACEDAGRRCDVEHPCGDRQYVCRVSHWDFTAGASCADPVPCDQAPVRGDACETAGEACTPPVEELPTLVCDGSSWTDESST